MTTMNTPVSELYGVGKTRALQLEKLGISRLRDLIYHFPRAYENRGYVLPLIEASVGDSVSTVLTVKSEPTSRLIRKGLTITKFRAFDSTASAEIIFFNAPYVKDVFHIGSTFRFYGKVALAKTKLTLQNPKYEPYIEGMELSDYVPVYPLTDGISSKVIEKLVRTALDSLAKDISDPRAYHEHCIANRLFLEELVIQHEGMNALCPASVNTIRMMTFNDHGNPRLLWMGLRIGNGVNAVDNFHAQGLAASIDMETGKLVGNAQDKDLREFTHHPTTGTQIDGFRIPCFEEAKELALKAAAKSDKILVVGWDVAISENGPVIIEGNRRPGFDMVQVLDDRGRLDIMESVLASLDKAE